MQQSANRGWMGLSMVLALFLALTIGLTFNPNVGDTASATGGATATAAAAEAHVIDVTLDEFSFSPSELVAPAGVPLTFNVTNAGVAEHDLTIEGVGGTEVLAANGTATLEVDALEPGTYTVLCTVSGHEAAGMVTTLTVTDEAIAVVDDGGHGGHGGHAGMSAAELAQKHDEGVALFPQESEGQGNLPMDPEITDDGVKVFELTAAEIEWETKPGVVREGMAYNGQIPGPQIHVDLGDTIRIVLRNELSEPTALHAHGLVLPNAMDGVPGLTQPSILPGESFTYEWEVVNSGSHMYHSHFNSAEQVTKGLLGAFIVHDPEDPEVDVDYVMIANDGPLGYTLNGKDFPATEPIVAKKGDQVRIRYMNEGLQIHPMHLHGMPQLVIAKDGYYLPEPRMEDTVLVGPGERIDVIVDASEVGAWALHCHVLTHAEGPEGMFGMVTALIVEE